MKRLSPADNPGKGVAVVSCHNSSKTALAGRKMPEDMFGTAT
jgi:hypothetical protein